MEEILWDAEEVARMGRLLDEEVDTEEGRQAGIHYAKSLLRVRERSGKIIALDANPVQREYERNRGRKNIVLKARQMGISTWVAGRLLLKTISQPGTLTVQVAHTQAAAESIFRIVHRFVEHLPPYMQEGMWRTSRSNVRQIAFPALDSEYRVESAGDSNAGRGLTITNLHCSEVARWPGDGTETLQGLRGAIPGHGELILESTPMAAGGCFWREWQEAEATGTVAHFFPWWLETSYVGMAVGETTLTEAERRLMQDHGLTHAQIGYRRQTFASYRGLAKQEFAEDPGACFSSSGESVFELEAMNSCELRAPLTARLNGQIHIWYPAVKDRSYLVAVDPAGGGAEGDYSVAQVIDLDSGLQCAELRARMGGVELATEVAKLGREYNQALLVVERNNHGSGTLAYLNGVCRYGRVYKQGGQQGWLTSQLTRPRILGLLGAALVESPGIFSSARLLSECRTFVRHRNGSMAAQSGEHDDCIMAMAMALAVRDELLAKG
jgi:hypothetical protein